MKHLLKTEKLSKAYKGVLALDNFTTQIDRGEIVSFMGPNGAGKTTLFNVITGMVRADRGGVRLDDKEILGKTKVEIANLGIRRTFQNLRLITSLSVLDNVCLWISRQKGENLYQLLTNYSIVKNEEKDNREYCFNLIKQVGLQDYANVNAGELSYGQQKLLSICCCFASSPSIALLDEPVAGISPKMVEVVEEFIINQKNKQATVLLIEHRTDVIERISDKVIFMNAGKKVCEGNFATVRNNEDVINSYL